MNRIYPCRAWALVVSMLLVATAFTAKAQDASELAEARTALLAALEGYEPGAPIDPDLAASIDAAAQRLESLVPVPDLAAEPERAQGLWVNLFSTQGVVGELDVAFMTRTLPGGGQEAGEARALTVLQELDIERGFYRNTMTMEVGPERIPMLYLATARLTVASEEPNVLGVLFREITFAPARADVTLGQLRDALGLPADTPLSIQIPITPERQASTSTVTYVDESLRINRGKDYFAVLQRVR